MKIIQNNIWMCFLIIGLITSSLSLSCSKTHDPVRFAQFNFVNLTSHNITYIKDLSNYNLTPNGTYYLEKTQYASTSNDGPEKYQSPFGDNNAYKSSGIKFIIKFDSNKCWEPPFEDGHSPLDIRSYTSEKIGKRTYKFTYTFTEADYNRAVICP